jgi:hypothetical protein
MYYILNSLYSWKKRNLPLTLQASSSCCCCIPPSPSQPLVGRRGTTHSRSVLFAGWLGWAGLGALLPNTAQHSTAQHSPKMAATGGSPPQRWMRERARTQLGTAQLYSFYAREERLRMGRLRSVKSVLKQNKILGNSSPNSSISPMRERRGSAPVLLSPVASSKVALVDLASMATALDFLQLPDTVITTKKVHGRLQSLEKAPSKKPTHVGLREPSSTAPVTALDLLDQPPEAQVRQGIQKLVVQQDGSSQPKLKRYVWCHIVPLLY